MNKDQIIEAIKAMTVLELNELVKDVYKRQELLSLRRMNELPNISMMRQGRYRLHLSLIHI